MNPRMHPGESDADFCRRMGWGVGQYLVGDEGYGPTVIKLTAIGEDAILARSITHRGDPQLGSPDESTWMLNHRDWRPCDAPDESEVR